MAVRCIGDKMAKVGDVVNSSHYGKIIKTKSEKFGEHYYLIAKYPAKSFCDECIFIKISCGHALFFSSMKDDEVLEIKEW